MPEGVSALEILQEVNPGAIPAAAPPEASNYRPADLQGLNCASCVKFVFTGTDGEGDGAVPTGYCSQYEANVRGDYISDSYASGGPQLDKDGNEIWDFADQESSFAEIHLAGASTEEKDGFVIKEVLRTGEWPVIPTGNGLIKQPLRVVRDGSSSKDDGVLSMAEIVENFKAGAIANPQIPLSDDEKDHKNLTRLNTGFVRDIWIEDKDGGSVLKAKMEFTEPDVKARVLRGTYADVSCGIPWGVRSRGKEFGSTLEHVAITNRPFIDGLGPFLAASDKEEAEVEVTHFGDQTEIVGAETETPEVEVETEKAPETFLEALQVQFGLSPEVASQYTITSIDGADIVLANSTTHTAWTVPFTASGTSVSLADFSDWKVVNEEKVSDKDAAPSGALRQVIEMSDLENSHRLRELRLSQPNGNGSGGSAMPENGIELLDGLELSDEARAAIQNVLDENASLRSRSREQDADSRIEELKELGLEDRPGALKFYRQVFLSDDGGPAVVLLSDDGKEEKSRLTALEVLDSFIEGIKGSDGKLALSDQHLASGNDNKAPENADEETPVAERLKAAKTALYGE